MKDKVTEYLDAWNGDGDITVNGQILTAEDREEIKYTDTLSLIIDMIDSMIDVVTIALVAFTSLSLVVSCVMIAIITYVSVMERVKEIGVIRSLGGRKKDVSNLFNAETFIIGLSSGVFGIGITYLIQFIANAIIGHLSGVYTIADLPINEAITMIILSIVLTCISGLIPAKSAAKKDPVVALRTE
jgi:putative ABC transport system permease protein